MQISVTSAGVSVIMCLLFVGCGGDSTQDQSTSATPATDSTTQTINEDATTEDSAAPATTYRPIQLGGSASSTAADSQSTGQSGSRTDEAPKFEDVVAALKPIQIMLGTWQGIIRNASRNEVHDWVWDLKSDPTFPALVLTVPDGEFFNSARITYDPRIAQYLMTTEDAEGLKRSFTGKFIAEPKNIPSEDGKSVERTFQLELTEVSDEPRSTRYQYVFKQQHNNRYLVDVKRARGKAAFRLVDVIGSQRDGVSFAKADDDYGDKTCIISGGLGTSTVSYKGKTYYVCCSGCKAAFEDEPERWIARLEEQKAEKMKSN